MAGSVNKVILIGNVGADPEIRRTQDGRAIANLRIATSESWRDKNSGEKREKTEWHRVVIFNEGLCKVVEQYIKKGAKLYIEGQLQTRKWQNKEGQDQYSTEVVLQGFNSVLTMLDGRTGGIGAGMERAARATTAAAVAVAAVGTAAAARTWSAAAAVLVASTSSRAAHRPGHPPARAASTKRSTTKSRFEARRGGRV